MSAKAESSVIFQKLQEKMNECISSFGAIFIFDPRRLTSADGECGMGI